MSWFWEGRFPESDEGLRAVIPRWDEKAVNKEFEFFRFTWNDGYPQAGIHRSSRLDDLGHGSVLAERIGTSASGVALAFGLLRGWEIKKEEHNIGHALQIIVPREPDNFAVMLGKIIPGEFPAGGGTPLAPNTAINAR